MAGLGLNEKGFALLMNVAPATVRSWTTGAARPSKGSHKAVRLCGKRRSGEACGFPRAAARGSSKAQHATTRLIQIYETNPSTVSALTRGRRSIGRPCR
jgi:hypothetical protein